MNCIILLAISVTSILFRPVWSIRFGETAPPGTVDFVSRITVMNGSKPVQICSGILISPSLVYTALHCLTHWPKMNVQIGIGEYAPVKEAVANRRAIKVLYPQKYNTTGNWFANARFDWGIIVLDSPVNMCGGSLPTDKLPSDSNNKTECRVYGWGQTQDIAYNPVFSELKYAVATQYRIDHNAMCLRVEKYRKGAAACSGDSGGPLICDINGKPTVIGTLVGGKSAIRGKNKLLVCLACEMNAFSLTSLNLPTLFNSRFLSESLRNELIHWQKHCYGNNF